MEISRAQAQELIRLIQENEISKFFEQIDNDKIKAPQINQLRQEFISGKYFHDYYERLQVFINSIANTDFEVILPKYDIFFSFSSKNIEEAQRNVIILRKCGLSVFFSDEDLKNQAGNEFGKKIEKALENSEHFLLCCTPEAMKSHWVDKEYRAFHDHFYMRTDGQRRFFILEGANFDLKLLTLFLRNIQTCASIDEIVRILGKKTIEDHLAERKADYQELFGLFFEDKVITNTERKHLQFKQKSLELTDEQVDEVENGVKSEQVQAQLAQEQAEKEERESKEQELFERTQTNGTFGTRTLRKRANSPRTSRKGGKGKQGTRVV